MQNTATEKNNILCDSVDLSLIFGGKESSRFTNFINNKSDDLFSIFNSMIAPRLSYRTNRITSTAYGTVCFNGCVELESVKLSKVMNHCESAVCFVATIGGKIEKEIARLTNENSLFDAYILDSMGSMAVEKMAEEFWKDMQKKYFTEDKGITLRFSPGYCDWPIIEQNKLFHRLLDARQTDVTLTDSCLMNPRKSISGLFGIHPFRTGDGPVSPYNPCSDCKKRNCSEKRFSPK
ncbi:MAG: hypothetical protein JXA35_02045 [Deltaproteobacteria bacterium]|nr:hypothetical protein [Deltaproteobacteria bacterium]